MRTHTQMVGGLFGIILAIVGTSVAAQEPKANKWMTKCFDICGGEDGCVEELLECQKARDAFEKMTANAAAQFNLGLMYANGWGGPRDEAGATRLFYDAAVGGLPEARYELGVRLLRGRGAPVDHIQALVWLELAKRSQYEGRPQYRSWLLETMSESEIQVATGIADGIAASSVPQP